MASVSVAWAATRACSERWTARTFRGRSEPSSGVLFRGSRPRTTEPVTSERTPPSSRGGAEVASDPTIAFLRPDTEGKKLAECKAVSF